MRKRRNSLVKLLLLALSLTFVLTGCGKDGVGEVSTKNKIDLERAYEIASETLMDKFPEESVDIMEVNESDEGYEVFFIKPNSSEQGEFEISADGKVGDMEVWVEEIDEADLNFDTDIEEDIEEETQEEDLSEEEAKEDLKGELEEVEKEKEDKANR